MAQVSLPSNTVTRQQLNLKSTRRGLKRLPTREALPNNLTALTRLRRTARPRRPRPYRLIRPTSPRHGWQKILWHISTVLLGFPHFLDNSAEGKPSNTPKKKLSQRDCSHIVKSGDLAIFQPLANSNIICGKAPLP